MKCMKNYRLYLRNAWENLAKVLKYIKVSDLVFFIISIYLYIMAISLQKNVPTIKNDILKKTGLKFQNPNWNILCKLQNSIWNKQKKGWIRNWLYRTSWPGKWDSHYSGTNSMTYNLSHGTELACFHHPYNLNPGWPVSQMR